MATMGNIIIINIIDNDDDDDDVMIIMIIIIIMIITDHRSRNSKITGAGRGVSEGSQ